MSTSELIGEIIDAVSHATKVGDYPDVEGSHSRRRIIERFKPRLALDVERFREAYWQEHSTPLIRQIHPEYRKRSDERADALLARLTEET